MRVGVGVEELLPGLLDTKPLCLGGIERTGGVAVQQVLHGTHLLAVFHGQVVGFFGKIVAEVLVASVAGGTNTVVETVEAVGGGKDVFAWRRGRLRAEEGTAVQIVGCRDTRQAPYRGQQIDETDQIAVYRTRAAPVGEGHDHRHAQAAVVEQAFLARQRAAVIGVPKDDGFIEQAVGFELVEQHAHLPVHALDIAVHPLHVAPRARGIYEVGRQGRAQRGIERWARGGGQQIVPGVVGCLRALEAVGIEA